MEGKDGPSAAQTITVTVQDSDSGGPVYNELVKIVSGANGHHSVESVTDINGHAFFTLEPGTYRIEIRCKTIFAHRQEFTVPCKDSERLFCFGV